MEISKIKISLILILICILILAGYSPTINSIILDDNNENLKDGNKTSNDEEYKKTGIDNNVFAYASFYWEPEYPDPGEKVTFYSNSFASNGYITLQRWTFEGGKKEIGHMATHTFENEGNYKVTLYVMANGLSTGFHTNFRTATVRVGADPFPRIQCTPEDPSPKEEVILDGSASADPDGHILSYNWSYYKVNDPKNVTYLGSNPVIYHHFKTQGTYVVLLNIEDNNGNNNTFERIVIVSILKIVSVDTFSRKLSFRIENSGSATANNIRWEVKINRQSILGRVGRTIHQKSKIIPSLEPQASKNIELRRIRRKLCKFKIDITADADNAVKISKTYYGRIMGKFVILSKESNRSPLSNSIRFLATFGAGLAFLMFLIFILSRIPQFIN